MIDKTDVVGYTDSDTEYTIELWDAVRGLLTAEEATELIRGNRSGVCGEGIEAMEDFLAGDLLVGDQRPPTTTGFSYEANIERRLLDVPPRLALQAWQSELEFAKSGFADTEWKLHGIISVLRVGEEHFDVDLTDEIVEVAQQLPESETKLDFLDERDAISGQEWFERTEEVQAEESIDSHPQEA